MNKSQSKYVYLIETLNEGFIPSGCQYLIKKHQSRFGGILYVLPIL
jgi:hypothetical protein